MRTRHAHLVLAMGLLGLPVSAFAGVAGTSATAGSNGRGPGTAGATATYDGDGIGLTRTKATSGRLNLARGLSVGVDADGLSVSHSYALAGRFGPAVGGTFNLHIAPDGKTSVSNGRATAEGDRNRSVRVGGEAGQVYGRPVARAAASGTTGPRGRVHAVTQSRTTRGNDFRARRGNRVHVSRRSRWR